MTCRVGGLSPNSTLRQFLKMESPDFRQLATEVRGVLDDMTRIREKYRIFSCVFKFIAMLGFGQYAQERQIKFEAEKSAKNDLLESNVHSLDDVVVALEKYNNQILHGFCALRSGYTQTFHALVDTFLAYQTKQKNRLANEKNSIICSERKSYINGNYGDDNHEKSCMDQSVYVCMEPEKTSQSTQTDALPEYENPVNPSLGRSIQTSAVEKLDQYVQIEVDKKSVSVQIEDVSESESSHKQSIFKNSLEEQEKTSLSPEHNQDQKSCERKPEYLANQLVVMKEKILDEVFHNDNNNKMSVINESENEKSSIDPELFKSYKNLVEETFLESGKTDKNLSGHSKIVWSEVDSEEVNVSYEADDKINEHPIDGSTYSGDYNLFGLPHGMGTQKWLDGSVYHGWYENGKKHGRGTYYYPDKSYAIGDFENDYLVNGSLFYSTGQRYTGPFLKNKPHGDGGHFLWKANSNEGNKRIQYKGRFNNGNMCGLGEIFYGNQGPHFKGAVLPFQICPKFAKKYNCWVGDLDETQKTIVVFGEMEIDGFVHKMQQNMIYLPWCPLPEMHLTKFTSYNAGQKKN